MNNLESLMSSVLWANRPSVRVAESMVKVEEQDVICDYPSQSD